MVKRISSEGRVEIFCLSDADEIQRCDRAAAGKGTAGKGSPWPPLCPEPFPKSAAPWFTVPRALVCLKFCTITTPEAVLKGLKLCFI